MRLDQRLRIDFKNVVLLFPVGLRICQLVEAAFGKPKESFRVQQFIPIRWREAIGQGPSEPRVAHRNLVSHDGARKTVARNFDALGAMLAFDLSPFWWLHGVVVQECTSAQQRHRTNSQLSGKERQLCNLIFSLKVTNPKVYARYRAAIAPVLERFGGKIAKEYDVAHALHSDDEAEDVTKIAMFAFPEQAALDAFFADPAYQAAKPDLLASVVNISKWAG